MTTEELTPTGTVYASSMSRLDKVPLLQDGNGAFFFPTYTPHSYPLRAGDFFHEVGAGEEGRLDLISYLYYQTTLLWWVVAEANDLFNPIQQTIPGVTLRIPDPNYILTVFVR